MAKPGTAHSKQSVIHNDKEYSTKPRVPDYQTVNRNTKPRVPEYQVLSRTSKPPVPEYQIISRTVRPRMPEYQSVRRPEYQIIPGYSKIMDATLNIKEESGAKVTRYGRPKSQVSLASSLGTVRGPDYPHRPNLAPATLQSVVKHTKPAKQFKPQNKRNSITKSYSSNKKQEVSIQKKDSSNLNQPKSGIETYDPFEFQLTKRPKNKQVPVKVKESSILANRLDSRYSIQV